MNASTISDAVGSILLIALVTTVLKRGSDAANVMRALGDTFAHVITAATQ